MGFTGYDTVRYTYPSKIPFADAPDDDRGLLDMHLALYKDMAIFDSATKLIYLVSWVEINEDADVGQLFSSACGKVRVWPDRTGGVLWGCHTDPPLHSAADFLR